MNCVDTWSCHVWSPNIQLKSVLKGVYENIKYTVRIFISYSSVDLYGESVYLASWLETLYYFRWVWHFHSALLVLRCRWTVCCPGLWSCLNGSHWMIVWASDTWCVTSRSDTRRGTQTTPTKHTRKHSYLQTIEISVVGGGDVLQLRTGPFGLADSN
jgi:hypothetical protein